MKKDYFNLEDVANQLKCLVGDLLHYAAQGALTLSVLLAGEKATLHVWDSDPIENENAQDFTENDAIVRGERIYEELFGPFALCLRDAKKLEAGCLHLISSVGNHPDSHEFSEWSLIVPMEMPDIKIVVDHDDFKKFRDIYCSTNEAPVTREWKQKARTLGDSWMKSEEKKTGKRPTVKDIAMYLEGELSNRSITGARGKFLDWETIKREALKGITGRKPGDNLKNRRGNPHQK